MGPVCAGAPPAWSSEASELEGLPEEPPRKVPQRRSKNGKIICEIIIYRIMELVETLMASRKWRNMCLRYNIVTPDKIQVWKSTKLALTESNSPTKSRHDQELKRAIEAIATSGGGRARESA